MFVMVVEMILLEVSLKMMVILVFVLILILLTVLHLVQLVFMLVEVPSSIHLLVLELLNQKLV